MACGDLAALAHYLASTQYVGWYIKILIYFTFSAYVTANLIYLF